MLENLEDVILFASLAHNEQKMCEPSVPYLTHVFGVASNVLEAYYNGKEDFNLDYALKLAILHDTIEDTNITYENIENKYGKDIADGVLALTKNEELEKYCQMKDSLERILTQKKEVAIVKLADRTFNMRDIPSNWDNQKRERYLNEAKLVLSYLKDKSVYLTNKLTYQIDNYPIN
jgi:guanosine-3',5'-bis(diphosphate) 3'-pyrophosphohydrolase